MKVSILMSVCYRPTLWRTLESWSNLNWPDVEFLICDNASADKEDCARTVREANLPNTVYYREEEPHSPSVRWNELYKKCTGDFVIITMQDEIISSKYIIQNMLDAYEDGVRVSVLPYELTEQMTNLLDTINWKTNPKLIEELPGFWTDPWCDNIHRKEAGLLTHTTGQFRKDWDYLGMFRPEDGYLLQDRDIHLREQILKKPVHTPKTVVTYHQYHERSIPGKYIGGPSFTYRTEREARLLDPVEPD
jgi:glycosyltransferase involved in cell wall biosynthesis